MPTNLIFDLVLSGLVSGMALRLNALTLGGALAATIVATLILASSGLGWAALLLLFFLSSSTLSKLPSSSAAGVSGIAAKSDQRDAAQVLANGAVPAVCAVTHLADPSSIWLAAYSGALAAVTADTWATEVGTRSSAVPRSLLTGRSVTPGTSGGVTKDGTLAAIAGSLFVAAATVPLGVPLWEIGAIALGGVTGSLADSALGATVQEVRWCSICGLHTEQKRHARCGSPTSVTGGIEGFTNDHVNFLCSLVGAFVPLGIAILL